MTKRIPASIVAVVVTALVAYFAYWPIATIGSKFEGVDRLGEGKFFGDLDEALKTARQLLARA